MAAVPASCGAESADCADPHRQGQRDNYPAGEASEGLRCEKHLRLFHP